MQRFTILLVGLLALLVAIPLLGDDVASDALFDVLFSAVLMSGAFAVDPPRRQWIVGFAVLAVLSRWLVYVSEAASLPLLRLVLSGAVLAYLAGAILKKVVSESEVTRDTIVGGINAYLILGVVWAVAYGILEVLEPESFQTGGSPLARQPDQTNLDAWFPDLLYHSFVTLTTLGYGDIVPATRAARMACAFEAVLGQLFLATLIARLVGVHAQRSTPNG